MNCGTAAYAASAQWLSRKSRDAFIRKPSRFVVQSAALFPDDVVSSVLVLSLLFVVPVVVSLLLL